MVVTSLLDTQRRSTNVRFCFDSLALSPIPNAVDWIVVTVNLVSFQKSNILVFKYDSVNKQNEQLINR